MRGMKEPEDDFTDGHHANSVARCYLVLLKEATKRRSNDGDGKSRRSLQSKRVKKSKKVVFPAADFN